MAAAAPAGGVVGGSVVGRLSGGSAAIDVDGRSVDGRLSGGSASRVDVLIIGGGVPCCVSGVCAPADDGVRRASAVARYCRWASRGVAAVGDAGAVAALTAPSPGSVPETAAALPGVSRSGLHRGSASVGGGSLADGATTGGVAGVGIVIVGGAVAERRRCSAIDFSSTRTDDLARKEARWPPLASAAARASAAHEVLETSRRFEPNGLSNEYVMFSPGAIGSSWLSP